MVEWRCAGTMSLEDLVFTQLKIAHTIGDLQVESQKMGLLICRNVTTLWHTSVTKIDVFVNCGASGLFAAADIDRWVMWACLAGHDHVAWLQGLDEDAGLNAQTINRPESRRLGVNNRSKNFQCNLTVGRGS